MVWFNLLGFTLKVSFAPTIFPSLIGTISGFNLCYVKLPKRTNECSISEEDLQ